MKKTLTTLIIMVIIFLITYFSKIEKTEIEEKENIEEMISIEVKNITETKELQIEKPIILEVINEGIVKKSETYYFSFSNFFISNEDQEIINNKLEESYQNGEIINYTGIKLDNSLFELFEKIEADNIITGSTIDVFGNVIYFNDCKSNKSGKKVFISEGTNKEGYKNNSLINSILCYSDSYSFKVEIRINYLTFREEIISEKKFHIDTLLIEKQLKALNKKTRNLSANTNGMFQRNNNHGYLIKKN